MLLDLPKRPYLFVARHGKIRKTKQNQTTHPSRGKQNIEGAGEGGGAIKNTKESHQAAS